MACNQPTQNECKLVSVVSIAPKTITIVGCKQRKKFHTIFTGNNCRCLLHIHNLIRMKEFHSVLRCVCAFWMSKFRVDPAHAIRQTKRYKNIYSYILFEDLLSNSTIAQRTPASSNRTVWRLDVLLILRMEKKSNCSVRKKNWSVKIVCWFFLFFLISLNTVFMSSYSFFLG